MDLVVDNLGVARGGVAVLEHVGFRLAPGQVLILRGANGVGKTTLLRTVAGLQPPLAGTVSGAEDLAYGAHADGLKAMLTVSENLGFWASVYGGRVAGALQAMNLTGLADRRAADLSAGQKRRLGLARMMVTGRKVWLLDEPTVSLDAASVQLFGTMLRGHLGQGGSAVIATHVELGIEAAVLDLTPFKAVQRSDGVFDEAFL
ncbi:MAG: heme ABC exporter ATP-binding protein CcmA [Candidatus Saccharibacteria bacterium]|nr:heme ABC exporter ATP-binding protein CcmA [Pseudorhodobacter sp.]